MKQSPIAFLGPSGSYAERALAEHLNPSVKIPAYSIAEVFRLLIEGQAELGFVPVENMLQGPVTETLDLLFEHRGKVFIDRCYLSTISHCLGVLPNKSSEVDPRAKISKVFSHQQALRQCSGYLRKHLSQAERCSSESTGTAAEYVKKNCLENAAVIAAEEKLISLGFEIIDRDIADVAVNKTRFVLLKKGDIQKSLASGSLQREESSSEEDSMNHYVTSIVVDPGRDRQGLLYEILTVISIQHQVNLLSIHSRPDTRGGFVFHLDLEGHVSDLNISSCLEVLHQFCLDNTGKSAEVIVCGSYRRTKFHKPPFRTLGLLGGKGRMGRWFADFFSKVGLEVLLYDKDSELSLKEISQRSDILLLSVPMSSASKIANELCSYLKPGQLVVENCSIKSCALPTLLENSPKDVEVLGIHTMFAEDVPSLRGQNVIITHTEKSFDKAQAFEDLLYKHGAMITHASIKEHDQTVAFLQALIQFSMLSLADVMHRTFPSTESIEAFSTPNSRAVLQTMKRVLSQKDDLLIDLQTLNDQYPAIRQHFLETVAELGETLDEHKTEKLLELAKRGKKFISS